MAIFFRTGENPNPASTRDGGLMAIQQLHIYSNINAYLQHLNILDDGTKIENYVGIWGFKSWDSNKDQR
jgi:hypothetical protein